MFRAFWRPHFALEALTLVAMFIAIYLIWVGMNFTFENLGFLFSAAICALAARAIIQITSKS